MFDTAALSIRKFRKVTKEISKLSTGQKLLGGLALVAGGLAYLALRPTDAAAEPATGAWQLPEANPEKAFRPMPTSRPPPAKAARVPGPIHRSL